MRLSFTSIDPALKPCLKDFNNLFLGCHTHAATSHCAGRPQLKQRQAHPSPARKTPYGSPMILRWNSVSWSGPCMCPNPWPSAHHISSHTPQEPLCSWDPRWLPVFWMCQDPSEHHASGADDFSQRPLGFPPGKLLLSLQVPLWMPPLWVCWGASPPVLPQEVKHGIFCVPTAYLASAIPLSHVVCVLLSPS